MSPPTEQNLFNNKLKIHNNGDFEAIGHFHATKSIKVHDGFEILERTTEEVIFEVFVAGLSSLDNIPECFDNTLIFRTKNLNNPNKMQYAFWNKILDRPSLVLNQGAPNRASIFERSLIVGAQKGAKLLDGNYTDGADFENLDFDTTQHGADLGVENNAEILGGVFVDQIHESTPDAGVSINEVFKVIAGEVYILNLAGQGNKPIQVDDDGRLYTLP